MRDEEQNGTNRINEFLLRAKHLESEGLEYTHAFGLARLEERIKNWPSQWGNALEVLIFGDFNPPQSNVDFPELGITLYRDKVTNTFITTAHCVLKARVAVSDRAIPAVMDASRRIGILIGTFTLVGWANSGCGWWCYVTHGGGGGVFSDVSPEEWQRAITGFLQLPDSVQRRLESAMNWLRLGRGCVRDYPRNDLLHMYSAYWNAFEGLIEAVNIVRPQPRLSRSEKQNKIDLFVSQRSGKLTPSDVTKCYQEIVNPGFVGKASHALRVCFGADAEKYIEECFLRADRLNRLYDVRNAIDHGNVDPENVQELARIEARLSRLTIMILGIWPHDPFPSPSRYLPS